MNSPAELGFDHRYIPGSAHAPTLLLLHGTGGDGDSLLQLGDTLYPGATLLSPTGNVREHGAPRFFRRLAMGVFDVEDLRVQTDALAKFVCDAIGTYALDASHIVAVGYSNGANIAASVLLMHPGLLAGAVLFRAMVPFTPEILPAIPQTPVLLCAGEQDPYSAGDQTEALSTLLRSAGAEVEVRWDPGGHELSMGDVRAAQAWLQQWQQQWQPGRFSR